MQNITANAPFGNLPGNRQIVIIPTEEVSTITLSNINTKKVILKTGGAFGKIDADEIVFSCKEEEGRYVHEISCRMVSTMGKWDALFNRMKNKRWLVKIVDFNNTTWLSGSLTEPLRFSWEHLGEDKPTGEHAYKLLFYRESTEPLFVTDPVSNYSDKYWLYEVAQQEYAS